MGDEVAAERHVDAEVARALVRRRAVAGSASSDIASSGHAARDARVDHVDDSADRRGAVEQGGWAAQHLDALGGQRIDRRPRDRDRRRRGRGYRSRRPGCGRARPGGRGGSAATRSGRSSTQSRREDLPACRRCSAGYRVVVVPCRRSKRRRARHRPRGVRQSQRWPGRCRGAPLWRYRASGLLQHRCYPKHWLNPDPAAGLER